VTLSERSEELPRDSRLQKCRLPFVSGDGFRVAMSVEAPRESPCKDASAETLLSLT